VAKTLTLDEADVQEHFFEQGWTDGLPIVPPTIDRVQAMLAGGWVEAGDIIGAVPERNKEVTAELAAINAVMAGCRPEYFPFVIAGLQAVLDPAFNANAAVTSTGGAALCTIVSGPGAAAIGMNAKHNAMGSGNRPNATIGRALRLVAANVLDAKVGKMDGSSFGHPGKYSFCFAEDVPPEGWTTLREDFGYELGDTTVTVFASEGPRQIANHLTEDGEELCRTLASAARMPATFSVGKGCQGVAVIGPEHRLGMVESGMSKQDVRDRILALSRIHPDELMAAGVHLEVGAGHPMIPGDDGLLDTFSSPEALLVTVAGGHGAGWSSYIAPWAPTKHSRITTRRVREEGDSLPECGPGGCELPADFFSRLEKKD
jgi:hypothetical protein